jgi:hypothetical protein
MSESVRSTNDWLAAVDAGDPALTARLRALVAARLAAQPPAGRPEWGLPPLGVLLGGLERATDPPEVLALAERLADQLSAAVDPRPRWPLLGAFSRLVRRFLRAEARLYCDAVLARQAAFNRAVVTVLRALLERERAD